MFRIIKKKLIRILDVKAELHYMNILHYRYSQGVKTSIQTVWRNYNSQALSTFELLFWCRDFCLANWYWVYRSRFHCSLFSFMLVSLDLTFSHDEISHCKPSTYFINIIKGYEVSMLFLIFDESKWHMDYLFIILTISFSLHSWVVNILYMYVIAILAQYEILCM